MQSIEAQLGRAVDDFALAFSDGDDHDRDSVLVDAINEPVAWGLFTLITGLRMCPAGRNARGEEA